MPDQPKTVPREPPDVPEERKALVTKLTKMVDEAKDYWKPVFARMKKDQQLAKGWQWKDEKTVEFKDSDRYKANLVHRHLRQRVAVLYAKNPRVVAKRRARLDFQVWDGDQQSIQAAQAAVAAAQAGQVQLDETTAQNIQTLMADYQQGMMLHKQMTKIGKTLEIMFGYFMQEGIPDFKQQLKQLIVRVLTCGVGYLKLNFQRVMERSPEMEGKLHDFTERLNHMERLAADVADGEIYEGQAEMEELRLAVAALQDKLDVVVREGLVFDFPKATQIIVDPCCTQLKGFLGADWVAQEYLFTPDKIQELYGVDIGKSYTKHDKFGGTDKRKKGDMAVVYQMWHMLSGLEYHICKGYPDFLKEPGAPDVELEQFHPLFTLTFNDLEDDDEIVPPSNVSLLRPMQIEYNRAREAVREHRIANRPALISTLGLLTEGDKGKLSSHAVNELLELEAVPPGTDVKTIIMAKPVMAIDPAVYEVEGIWQDIQRVVGDQEANLGGTSGSTATESSIAETSRVSSIQSNIDDLDDFLSAMARAGGQVLLAEMSEPQVKKIVGEGAVWPKLAAQEIAEEIFLEIKAGSSGRPNKAQEIANLERLAPFLLQLGGVNPKWLLEQFIERLDESIDLSEAYQTGAVSTVAANQAVQPSTGNAATDPNAQGPSGAANSPAPAASQPGPQPAFPAAGPPGT